MNERINNIERIMEQMNIDASIRLEEDKERRREDKERRREEDDRRREEDDRRREVKKERAEAEKDREEAKKEREADKIRREESDRRFNERFDKIALEAEKQREKDRKEANIRMKKLEQVMNGMGLTQGDISEEIIADNFGNVFNDIGEHISSIERNLTIYTDGGSNKRIRGEFDIIGTNGSKIFLGETKTKLTKAHIDKFINTTMPNFKKYDNRHDGMKLYGVLGARLFANDKVLPYAIKHGLYVIKETHKGTAKILKKSLVGVKSF